MLAGAQVSVVQSHLYLHIRDGQWKAAMGEAAEVTAYNYWGLLLLLSSRDWVLRERKGKRMLAACMYERVREGGRRHSACTRSDTVTRYAPRSGGREIFGTIG